MGSKILLSDVKPAPTIENFPALAHAFDFNSCDFAEKTITDHIAGVVLTPATNLSEKIDRTWLASGTIAISGANIKAPVLEKASGTCTNNIVNVLADVDADFVVDGIVSGDIAVTVAGVKAVITDVTATQITTGTTDLFPNGNEDYVVYRVLDTVLVTVNPKVNDDGSNGFTVGDSNTYGFTCAANSSDPFISTIGGATDYLTLGDASLSSGVAINTCAAVAIDWVNDAATTYAYDNEIAAVKSIAALPAAGSIELGILDSELVQTFKINGAGISRFAAIYFLYFDSGMPDDIAQAVAWMGENPGYLYPAWLGRS